jgi:hypothetical protein
VKYVRQQRLTCRHYLGGVGPDGTYETASVYDHKDTEESLDRWDIFVKHSNCDNDVDYGHSSDGKQKEWSFAYDFLYVDQPYDDENELNGVDNKCSVFA